MSVPVLCWLLRVLVGAIVVSLAKWLLLPFLKSPLAAFARLLVKRAVYLRSWIEAKSFEDHRCWFVSVEDIAEITISFLEMSDDLDLQNLEIEESSYIIRTFIVHPIACFLMLTVVFTPGDRTDEA